MSINIKILNPLRPFLKWAGGKTQLISEIVSRLPYKAADAFTYIEPFIGSGAVFFYLISNYQNIKKIIINDLNADLIVTYQTIAEQVELVIEILKNMESEYHFLSENDEEKSAYYYTKRKQYNLRTSDNPVQTALFIFLNKTCYNGLYRVNQKNQFNVPVGKYYKPLICDEYNLRSVSQALKEVEILNVDFEATLNYAAGNTFFYFDPPYKPISKTSLFNSYSASVFDDKEQIRLKKFCDKITELGYKWLLSNSDSMEGESSSDFFDELYKNYTIKRIPARRNINSNPDKRGSLNELIICNY